MFHPSSVGHGGWAEEKGSLPSLVSPLFGAALLLACLHLGPSAVLGTFDYVDVSENGVPGATPSYSNLIWGQEGGTWDKPLDGTGFFRYLKPCVRCQVGDDLVVT